jgi:hypothetical protein
MADETTPKQEVAEPRSLPSDLALRLSKAQALFGRGKQKQALKTLWFAEALARGNAAALPEVLNVARAFREGVEPRRKSDLTELVAVLQHDIVTAIPHAVAPRARAETDAISTTRYVLWLIALAVVGFVIWVVYALTASPLFPNCGSPNDLLGGVYSGGAASTGSLVTAVFLGVLLWLVVVVAALVLRRQLGLLFGGFVAAYLVGLVVLWNVSPLIWGRRYCA